VRGFMHSSEIKEALAHPSPIVDSEARYERTLADNSAMAIMPPGPEGEVSMIYHYTDPTTGNVVSSLLPPDHPEIECLQSGGHIKRTRFGPVGIAAAILWFPFGLGAMWKDRTVSCSRCHRVLKQGGISGSIGGEGHRSGERRSSRKVHRLGEGDNAEQWGRTRKQKGRDGARSRPERPPSARGQRV